MYLCVLHSLLKDLSQLKEGEFTLSKDTTVSLWTEYRTWYGEGRLQEVFGGDFVVVNDDLYDEFETFKKKVYSYVESAFRIVKGVELIYVWCTSCGVILKPLHYLGSVYYLMSSAQLDSLCQWVYAKRSLFSCKDDFSLKKIVESEDNTSTHPDGVVDEIVQAGPNTISYLPACDEWQKSFCQFLGMTFVRRNITHILQPIEFSIFHRPATTVRILGDGNCFFRALAFVITGSQDEHQELRTLEFYHATLMLMKQWMNIWQEQTCTAYQSGLQK